MPFTPRRPGFERCKCVKDTILTSIFEDVNPCAHTGAMDTRPNAATISSHKLRLLPAAIKRLISD